MPRTCDSFTQAIVDADVVADTAEPIDWAGYAIYVSLPTEGRWGFGRVPGRVLGGFGGYPWSSSVSFSGVEV